MLGFERQRRTLKVNCLVERVIQKLLKGFEVAGQQS